jgi:Transcriptional regulator
MSMTIAAEKLYMTQSAVSQAVKEMEQYYHCELFERLYHKLYITESGRVLYDYASRIITQCKELEGELNKPVDYNIRIGVNFTVGESMIYDFINEFKEKHNNVEVILYVNRASALKEMLKANKIDFALMEEASEKDLLEEIFFKQDRILFVSSMTSSLQQNRPLTPEELIKEKLLLREKGAGVRDLFDQNIIRLGLKAEPYWESNSTSALVHAVHNDMGISVLPYELIKEQLKCGYIRYLRVERMKLDRKLMITYSKNKYITSVMEDFFDIVINSSKSKKVEAVHSLQIS